MATIILCSSCPTGPSPLTPPLFPTVPLPAISLPTCTLTRSTRTSTCRASLRLSSQRLWTPGCCSTKPGWLQPSNNSQCTCSTNSCFVHRIRNYSLIIVIRCSIMVYTAKLVDYRSELMCQEHQNIYMINYTMC